MTKRKKFIFRKPCKICENMFTPPSKSSRICELCRDKINIHLHLSRMKNSFSKLADRLTQIPNSEWKSGILESKELIENAYNILSEEIKFEQRKKIKD